MASYGPASERLNGVSLETKTSLETCPYESSHQILPNRMQTHLKKCAAQNPKKKSLVICNLNFTHHIPSEKLKVHLETCPDRHKIDIYVFPKEAMVRKEKKQATATIVHEVEENWDDLECPTYNPQKAMQNNALLLCKKGVSKSERRTFQKEQRIHNSRILNGEFLHRQ